MSNEELEKEAEAFKESKRHRCFRADVETVNINYESYLNNLKQAYIAGAKAHQTQWHYVKDGEYPKEKCLAIVFSKIGGIQTYTITEITKKGLKDCKKVGVIAWKELVSPNLGEVEDD